MRLIDADAEIARIEQEMRRINKRIKMLKERQKEEPFNKCHNFEKELEQCYRNKADCKAEIATLKNYQTAYNVDKVVERLEELHEMVNVNRLLDDIIKDKPKELGQLIAYRKAIEIVKSGGIIG